jgi:hypothetical protein
LLGKRVIEALQELSLAVIDTAGWRSDGSVLTHLIRECDKIIANRQIGEKPRKCGLPGLTEIITRDRKECDLEHIPDGQPVIENGQPSRPDFELARPLADAADLPQEPAISVGIDGDIYTIYYIDLAVLRADLPGLFNLRQGNDPYHFLRGHNRSGRKNKTENKSRHIKPYAQISMWHAVPFFSKESL